MTATSASSKRGERRRSEVLAGEVGLVRVFDTWDGSFVLSRRDPVTCCEQDV